MRATISPSTQVSTDEYDLYARLCEWGYGHSPVCHGRGEYARDEDGDGFHQAQVGTLRLKLLKIGAVILRNTRRVRFLPSSAYPYQALFRQVVARLASG